MKVFFPMIYVARAVQIVSHISSNQLSSLSKAHILLGAFVIVISIMFISAKAAHFLISKGKEYLVYQRLSVFDGSSF